MDGGIVVTWIARGTSPVDWCEDNYSVTPHIAEFVNTISNVLFLLIPPACSSLWTSYSLHVSRGIHVVWFFFTVVGLSSAYFHATLSLLGQLLDELSILWLLLVSYSLFTPVCRRPVYMQKNPKVFKAFFALIGVLTSAFAFVKPEINQYALFMAGSPAMWMMIQEVRFCSNPKVGLFGKATIFALTTAIIVWVSDRFLCNVWQHLNLPVLHGVWHVLIFMASYMMLVLFCYIYAMHDVPQSKPDLRFWPYKMCGLPYIHCRSSSTFKDP